MEYNANMGMLECFNDTEHRGPERVLEIMDMNYGIEDVEGLIEGVEALPRTAGKAAFLRFLKWYLEDITETPNFNMEMMKRIYGNTEVT